MANRTKAQTKAIELRDKTLLISAAAGSGKTTVLIERLIRLLTDKEAPADISRMLIVTFTRAAASELRKRISVALSSAIAEDPKNKRLFKQLASLGSAKISTIDSFYGDVVRRYSQQLELPSSLRIADDSELTPLKTRIMNDVIDLGYEGKLKGIGEGAGPSDNDFTRLADSISDMRNDSELCKIFLSLKNKLNSHPRSIEFLLDCAEGYKTAANEDLFSTPYGLAIKDYIYGQIEHAEKILSEACLFLESSSELASAYLPAFQKDLDFCNDIISSLDSASFYDIRQKFICFSHASLLRLSAESKTKKTEYYCDLRTVVKEKIKKIKENYFTNELPKEYLESISLSSEKICRVLYIVLSTFDELYSKEKITRRICEFNDIKQWAYRLLVAPDGSPTEIALELSEGFDAIYIDEYQDVDPVQDLIFRSISKPSSRFMVGDVKQSIYGFRGAAPSLFMSYRSEFAQIDPESDLLPDSPDCTIFMSDNFRCDQSVVGFTNQICSYIFKAGSKSISYTDEDDLIFSKPVNDDSPVTPVTVALIDQKSDPQFNASEYDDADNLEAKYIANEISRLIKSENKSDGSRIRAGDVAVLSKSYAFCETVAEELSKKGIKSYGESSQSIFDDPEVSLAHSLLEAIDNPQRDIHLAATLMSPLFEFTADDLIAIRTADKKCSLYDALSLYSSLDADSEERDVSLTEKCRSFINTLEEIRTSVTSMSAAQTIQYVFSRFSFLSRDSGSGSSRQALLKLYESARRFEGDEFKGLYSYLKYIDNSIENGTPISSGVGDPSDAVRLMTIHKSKGLEFTVCFVANCASQFNRDDLKELVLYSSELGVAMDLPDGSGFGRIKTPYRYALARKITDSLIEEDMRVLYVALTRARERLYVTASLRYGVDRELEKAATRRRFSSRSTVTDANNYISWILEAISGAGENEKKYFNVLKITPESILTSLESNTANEKTDNIPVKYSEEELGAMRVLVRRNFEFEYPYSHISNLPAKLSVSKLSPDVLDRTDGEADLSIADSIDITPPTLHSTPSFMSELSGAPKASAAERGIATHSFLQFCNFESVLKNGVQNELQRLVADGFMNCNAQALVNTDQIERFFSSALFNKMLSARWIRREQRFNILLPARLFTRSTDLALTIKDEKILVQGVIDVFFEDDNGDLILCDYKTDSLSKEELFDRSLAQNKLEKAHADQLSYYAEALRSIIGKYPDKICIYSLPLGDSVEITLNTDRLK